MKNKTRLSIVTALALFVPGALSASDIDSFTRMEPPRGWQAAESADASANVAAAWRAPTVAGDRFEENVNWVVNDVEPGISIEEYSRRAERTIVEAVPAARILESTPDNLAGAPAHRVVFGGRLGSRPMRWMQIWTFNDGKVYVATYSADADDFESRLADAEEAIRSLRFGGAAATTRGGTK